jgi:hypothetical protein
VRLLRVFRVYNKVADSGDVVIEKQGFSIVDTHEPAIAMPLPPFCLYMVKTSSYENRICLVGRHQEVRRFVSPGLHHITPVSSHCRMLRNERHTSILFCLFLPSPATILCHEQDFRTPIYWDRCPRAAGNWWRGEGGAGVCCGDLMKGTLSSRQFEISLVTGSVEKVLDILY